jgi:hypothetical protein
MIRLYIPGILGPGTQIKCPELLQGLIKTGMVPGIDPRATAPFVVDMNVPQCDMGLMVDHGKIGDAE